MDTNEPHLIPVHTRAEIPDFQSEDEEVAFWDTHALTPELWKELEPGDELIDGMWRKIVRANEKSAARVQ